MAIGDDLMYVDNDKDEDQDFTAMKEPDQKKRYVFVNEVDDPEDDLPYKCRHIQSLLYQITGLDEKNMWSGKNKWQIVKPPKILY